MLTDSAPKGSVSCIELWDTTDDRRDTEDAGGTGTSTGTESNQPWTAESGAASVTKVWRVNINNDSAASFVFVEGGRMGLSDLLTL